MDAHKILRFKLTPVKYNYLNPYPEPEGSITSKVTHNHGKLKNITGPWTWHLRRRTVNEVEYRGWTSQENKQQVQNDM